MILNGLENLLQITRFSDFLSWIASHSETTSDFRMTNTASVDFRNVHVSDLLKVCIPDPASVNSICIVGIKEDR
ncbi:Uncharacterised protein [Streptococcus pneumoniae]|nr:Uncharacterised protein [Streptococcus pneumoniae]